MTRRAVLALVLCTAGAVRAQPAPAATPLAPPAVPTTAAACVNIDTTPGALLDPPVPDDQLATPIPWSDFVVEGQLKDPPAVVRALLEPTLAQYRTSLSAGTLPVIAKLTTKLGYQLVSHDTRPGKSGPVLVLRLAPLPIVRQVVIDIHQGLFDRPLDDDISRRMLLRPGAYLPWDPVRRQCALIEERTRIEEYLHDEGYFDASAPLTAPPDPDGTKVVVHVSLGAEYQLAVTVVQPAGFDDVTKEQIAAEFRHKPHCILGFQSWCFGTTRFTREQHLKDLQAVKDLFHAHGYPAARVQSDFDPRTSPLHGPHIVRVTITTDPRRRLDLHFDGIDRESITEDQLRQHLTFDESGSTDDIEIATSAEALQTYLQARGRFDAHVTWSRRRFEDYDRVDFHIDAGPGRQVQQVQFVCNGGPCPRGRIPFDAGVLAGIVAVKAIDFTSDLLGTTVPATTALLDSDLERLRIAYRRAGYRDTVVRVYASPVALPPPTAAPPEAAVTAALAETGAGNELYVRYSIDEGTPTFLERVVIEPADDGAKRALAGGLCAMLLHELAGQLAIGPYAAAARHLAARADPTQCIGVAAKLPFREDDVAATADRMRDLLFRQGRPRADVKYEARDVAPHEVEAHYTLATIDQRRIGKIVVRGNFRTRTSVIKHELDLHEGQLLTSDALAAAARRLRQTGLFDAVNIDLLDRDSDAEEINAVVNVEERYPNDAQVDLEGGYSSYNGIFGTAAITAQNLFHRGVSATLSGTTGQHIFDLESTLRIPKWLTHVGAQAEATADYRWQDTPRFGRLTTEGVTVGLTWIGQRPRTLAAPAQTRTLGVHYDYRLRTRNLDALRPIGADMDFPQVAVDRTTGSIGISGDLDERVDRAGQLSPLAPEAGFRLYGDVSYAAPDTIPVVGVLGGQDTFVKVSASASKFQPLGKNLVVRADFRYDEGFPLGGAQLLPDVERFFAGGDTTVRGYEDDKLATEIVRFSVPPLANVSQIRVIPAGGNIRVLGSLDAQYRIWKILAGALFTDAGMIGNDWRTVTLRDIRPSVGMGLRALTPFGIAALEYAVPIAPHLGDDPRGRIHFYFAARAQF